MSETADRITRPSRWWLALAGLSAVLAVALGVSAALVQRAATEPIGEGELFVEDAALTGQILARVDDPATGVRHARNALGIEAVSVVAESGEVTASTSTSLLGREVDNSFLAFSVAEGRFAALATPVGADILLDGVPAHEAGSILYQVVSPLDGGTSALLHYDISELLARRAPDGGIQPETLQLLGLTLILTLIGVALAVGHSRATRTQESMAKESELLRAHAEELRDANIELERARHEAERALELAEEKIRIRSEFVLMINHELRTPLTSVITGAKLLRDESLEPPDRAQVLEAMIDDGTLLQEMIDQVLAVARIENRGLSYELSAVGLDALCEAVTSARAELVTEGATSGGVLVHTDLGAMSLVVSSLVDNARTHGASSVRVHVGPESRIEPMVQVGAVPGHAVFVTVSDDGPGIDLGFLPHVFEKFEKSSSSPGTGLGLYMTRTIVEAIEGSIAVETSPSGTSFEIALPLVGARETVAGR